MLRRACAIACTVALAGAGGAIAAGHSSGRDPFFPGSGSGAFDVSHYGVSLSYFPRARTAGKDGIAARVRIEAHSRRPLRRVSLDLVGLRVTSVEIDSAPASFKRRHRKLIIRPPSPIPSGAEFAVSVSYRGHPGTITDPDHSKEGWTETSDGGAVALGEPVGTATWLPCNNSLTDKASFGVRLDAPARSRGHRLVAVSNGRLLSRRSHGKRVRWAWAMAQPMAPYLATVAFDNFRLRSSKVDGIPSWTAVDADLYRDRGALVRSGIRSLPEVIRFERRLFGPYPFDAVGTTITDGGDYALETQSRPTYPGPPRRNLLVHELAHQWVGDSTGLRRWSDIWLNEGFATFTEWIFRERHGGPSARSVFAELRRRPAADPFWSPPPGHPGSPKNLFDGAIYVRGAMTLEALRLRLGDRSFFRILRAWTSAHRYGNVSTSQFVAFVEQRSGRKVGPLLRRWLFRRGKA